MSTQHDPRDVRALTDLLSERDATISDQRDQINSLQQDAQKVPSLTAEIERLKSEADKVKGKNADLIGENANHDLNTRKLQSELAQAREALQDNDGLYDELQEARAAAEAAQEAQAAAEAKVNDLQEAFDECEAENARLSEIETKWKTLRSLLA